VLQKSDIASTTLLPLTRLAVELEKLCTHLKGLFLQLLVGLGLDFLGEMNDGLEVDFRRIDLLFSLQIRLLATILEEVIVPRTRLAL
jgi:hypothetical protein